MKVLTMQQVLELLALHEYHISRNVMTMKLTPILVKVGLAQKIPGGSRGVWVYQHEAVPALEKYLDRQGKVLRGSPQSRHSVDAFIEYTK